MTSPDMGPGGSWEAPDGSRPWNTGDSSPDGLAFMAAADEEHWRETAFRQPFRDSYNPIGQWSNGIGGMFTAIIGGLFNGWFGGGSVGDPQEVQYTIEAIKDAIISGYNVEAKVQTGTWVRPAALSELYVGAIGGGRNGGDGSLTTGGPGGVGGEGGGYIVQQIDPADIPVGASVSYTIGQANQATTFGSFLSVNGGTGGIANGPFGYGPTTSIPGRGGDGGKGAGADGSDPPLAGQPGQGSALGSGGTAGAAPGLNGNGNPGGAGGNVSGATATKSGGGGGGGGSGGGISTVTSNNRFGGAGGPGGYPGGGGGGGGGRGYQNPFSSSGAGAGGIGATGIIWIFWR